MDELSLLGMWNHGVRFLGAFVEATSKLLGSELDAPLFAPLLLMHTSTPCFRPSSLGTTANLTTNLQLPPMIERCAFGSTAQLVIHLGVRLTVTVTGPCLRSIGVKLSLAANACLSVCWEVYYTAPAVEVREAAEYMSWSSSIPKGPDR